MLCNRAEPEVRAPKRVRHFPGVARELQALLHIDVQGQEQGFPLPLRSLNPTPRSRRPHLRSAAWAMAALPGSRATWLHARPGMPAPPLSWEWPATAGTATPLRRAMDPSRCVIPHYAGNARRENDGLSSLRAIRIFNVDARHIDHVGRHSERKHSRTQALPYPARHLPPSLINPSLRE